jgi:multidrug/hemolysin transport system permease protein
MTERKNGFRRDMAHLRALTARHVKLYFKDKQTFLTSLITPLILVALFATFLRSVYVDSLALALGGVTLPKKLVNGFVAGWMVSSILGTSAVTIAFCSQTLMVADKAEKRLEDFRITPVKATVLSFSYFLATLFSTLLVCSVCFAVGLVYIAVSGWYLSVLDILSAVGCLVLCTAFGSLLAMIIESFLSRVGAASAVASLVSSLYGFVCGAYMPISQFSSAIANFVALIPGTHGVTLFRQAFMNGAIEEMGKYASAEVVQGVKEGFDNTLSLFGHTIPTYAHYLVLVGTVLVLTGIFWLVIRRTSRKQK